MPVMAIPSVQQDANGNPRFHVPMPAADPACDLVAQAERAGGVQAEVRSFLDAQLETGDVLLDVDPGVGFVALSAATAPGGMPAVFVANVAADAIHALQDAAADAGGWIEELDLLDAAQVCTTLDARLETEGRVFVHAAANNIVWVGTALAPLFEAGRVLAVCVSDAGESPVWPEAAAILAAYGFVPHELGERDGDVLLLPASGVPVGAVIAIATPRADAEEPEATPTEIQPASIPVMDDPRWNAQRDGFSFIAPHSRTGYGVAAAHLLRALQQRQVPVAFFPIGPVDASLTDNPQLREALRRQEAYRPDVPSVRLSQQFDLALHVGRGRQIGYTIFELDAFTPRERHHLRQQDAIIVCSEWARQVCLANGLDDRPVHVVPLGVDRRVFHEQVAPATSANDTVFLQVGKLEPRKGQLELLRAFEAAFTPKDAVRLVLVCGNPFIGRAELDAQLAPFRRSPMASRITLVTQELPTQQDVAAVMASADCGVFPVRAEGWNLEALEMLAMGRHVIATACTAHTEYLTPENSRLIETDGLEAPAGAALGRWAAWGDRQHEQLVAHLQAVHHARRDGRLGPNHAGIATATRYSWEHAADQLVRAIGHLG